jgi:hypothetical protein
VCIIAGVSLDISFSKTKKIDQFVRKVFKRIDEAYLVPEEILERGIKEILRCYKKANSKKSKELIIKKITHTQAVVEAGKDICMETLEMDWNLVQGAVVCFLHDIGRFEQALQETFSDSLSIDHATVGADWFKKQKWSILDKYGLNPDIIYEAIDRHSRAEYKGNNQYVKLARDADKIGLFRHASKVLVNKSLPEGPASRKVLSVVKKDGLVKYGDVKTQIDHYLSLLAWPKDFYFKITHDLYQKTEAPEWVKRNILKRDPRLANMLG